MRCLITSEPWTGPGPYSPAGLRRLDRRLRTLAPLPYTRDQLLEEAAARSVKMSVQGVQPKLGAVLRVTEGRMEIVDTGGRYIVKPPHPVYAELPENEALTMLLAATLGIEVPMHGLLQNADQTRSYFVRRFDRVGWNKRPVEDFAQLSGSSRGAKYDASTEQLVGIIDRFCTFPLLERLKFLDRLLCAFFDRQRGHAPQELVAHHPGRKGGAGAGLRSVEFHHSQPPQPGGTRPAVARQEIPASRGGFLGLPRR